MVVEGQDRQRGLLMLGVALVLVANVLIWAWPLARLDEPRRGRGQVRLRA